MEAIRRTVKFDNYFVVDSIGLCGGLALLWMQKVDVQIQSFSKWHISANFEDQSNNQTVLITGFYGHLETSKSEGSWNLSRNLVPNSNTPWVFFFGISTR